MSKGREPRNGEEAQAKWGSPLRSGERSDEEIAWWERYERKQREWGLGPGNADLNRARDKARRSDEEEERLQEEGRQSLAEKAGADPEALHREDEPEEEDDQGLGH